MPPAPLDRESYLLFVYNADAGLGRALLDLLHKIVSPATYPCSLCAITYGAVSMKAEWKAALAKLPLPSRFLHRDEYLAEGFDAAVVLPAVLVVQDGKAEPLLDGPAIDRIGDVASLAREVEGAFAICSQPAAVNRPV